MQLMRPDPSVPREYGAVYVGAGGNMLNVKPLLLEILHRSITYGLRLHGAHWDVDPLLAGSYKGNCFTLLIDIPHLVSFQECCLEVHYTRHTHRHTQCLLAPSVLNETWG